MLEGEQLKKKCLIVEGNIGVGKSSFLKLLSDKIDCSVVSEPHEKDIGKVGNLLEKFYEDTSRWAYTFQAYVFLARVLDQEINIAKSKKNILFFERSVFCDYHCFAKNCFEIGTMSKLEWDLYQEWFSWLVKKHVVLPEGFIYLRSNPEICFERMKIRNRKEESGVSLDYLKLLHKKHEDWLFHKKEVANCVANIPVLVLDRDKDWNKDLLEKDRLVNKVIDFFGISNSKKFIPAERSSSLSL